MLTPLAVKIAARLALIGFAVASTLELRKFNFLKTRVTSFKDNHIFPAQWDPKLGIHVT